MRNDFIMSSLKFFFFSLETTIFFRRQLTCEDLQSFVWKISMKFSLSLTVIAPERVEEGRNSHKFKFSSCFARKESALWENSWHECKKSFEFDLFSEESGSSSTLSLFFFSERHKKCFISERENFLDLSNVPVDTMCILCHSLIPI